MPTHPLPFFSEDSPAAALPKIFARRNEADMTEDGFLYSRRNDQFQALKNQQC